MHVGERPYVVVGTQTLHISTHELNLDAMTGMLVQLLPTESQAQLEEFGAVEHRLPQEGSDRFTVVAARGGDDIWIEIRRRRAQPAAVAVAAAPAPQPAPEMVAVVHPAVTDPAPIPVVAAVPEVPIVPETAVVAEVAVAPETPVVAEVTIVPGPEPMVEPAALVEVVEESAPAYEIAIEDAVATLLTAPEVEEPAPVVVAAIPSESDSLSDELTALLDEAAALEAAAVAEAIAMPVVASEAASVAEPVIALPPLESAHTIAVEARLEVAEPAQVPTADVAVPAVPEEAITREAPPREDVSQPAVAASVVSPAPPELAIVVPMTRTVRIEVPARAVPARVTTDVDRLLKVASARGATALFLTSESRPFIRVEGDMRQLESEPVLSRADVEGAILQIAPDGNDSVGKGEPMEWIAEFEDVGRLRCTTFTDHRGPGVLLRMIATRAATAEQLGLSREVQTLATESQGLVLVTGPRGSGKSTLMSALVDLVNRQRAEFIISLERQSRLVHDNKAALVSQREIRGGADDALSAARLALRESPDVLVIDDLLSPQMVPLLLNAASEGLLVLVSFAAASTAEAAQRFVEMASPDMRKGVQTALAESFRGAVAQVLLKKSGGGQIAAREILLATAPVARVISEGQLSQLMLALEAGRKHGMVSFTDALADFVRTGLVDVREAFRKAPDRDRLLDVLKRDGVDTSVVERLA